METSEPPLEDLADVHQVHRAEIVLYAITLTLYTLGVDRREKDALDRGDRGHGTHGCHLLCGSFVE